MMNRRFLSTTILLVAIIALPYWIYVPLMIGTMAFFPFYWESIILGFLIDVLYGEKIFSLYSGSVLTLIGLLILIPLRERLRSYV